ncbi:MAG: CvpA family protein [Ferruginibacter sp.]|nr:CvpA family protein [Ferruginibacter sp.]
MIIDSIFVILFALACYKGYTKGFIVSIFSVLGFIIGLAAALKLSTTAAAMLAEHTNLGKWLPILSFLLVFIATTFLINFVGKIIQKTFETVMLGWANRLAGIMLYVLLYSILLSVFLFYTVQLHLIKDNTTAASSIYPYLKSLAPKVMEYIGVVVPWFKNMFGELEQFFGTFSSTNKI